MSEFRCVNGCEVVSYSDAISQDFLCSFCGCSLIPLESERSVFHEMMETPELERSDEISKPHGGGNCPSCGKPYEHWDYLGSIRRSDVWICGNPYCKYYAKAREDIENIVPKEPSQVSSSDFRKVIIRGY